MCLKFYEANMVLELVLNKCQLDLLELRINIVFCCSQKLFSHLSENISNF